MARPKTPEPGTLGHLLGSLREGAGLNQADLATRCAATGMKGFNQGSVSRWELNKEQPSIAQFRVMMAVLRAPKRDLEAGISILAGLPVRVVGNPPPAAA